MAMTMHVDIVSAEAEIFSGTAEFVAAPAELGDVGIIKKKNKKRINTYKKLKIKKIKKIKKDNN
jgi:F0F1-type ATP synthase epsilon subunit